MFFFVTTRFSSDTIRENANYRQRHPNIKCIYGSSQPMAKKIPQYAQVFVIEMNNSLNIIEAIGLVENYTRIDKYTRIYETGNFNRYVYKGKFRLTRDDMDGKLLEILDYILFKEKTHMKRGSGFTQVPSKLLKHEKCENLDIRNMIQEQFTKKFQDVFIKK